MLENAQNRGRTSVVPDIIPYLHEDNSLFAKQVLECFHTNMGKTEFELSPNKIFIDDIKSRGGSSNVKVPALYIEEQLVRGDVTPLTSESAFCDVLDKKTKPAWCKGVARDLDDKVKSVLDTAESA